MTRRGRAAVCAVIASAAVAPSPAAASPFQRSMLQDDARLLSRGAAVRSQTLDELSGLGVDVVKLTLRWRDVAPGGSSRPAGFRADDPAAYPAERWQAYDEAIAAAAARRLEVLVQLSGPAPDWASEGRSRPAGVYRPSPREFGRFAAAVGRRYSGGFAGLPRVSMWSIWNEPNLPRFLLPQRAANRARTPASPHVYRGLLVAAVGGLAATGHAGDTIMIGELLPVGRRSRTTTSSLRPLEFLRELACVDSRYRPFRGRAARLRRCQRFRRLPGNGLAYHPYTQPRRPPLAPPPHPDDATIGQLGRIVRTLDRLGRRGRLGRGMTLHLTEFGYQTDPPDRLHTPLRRVDDYLAEAEYLAFRNPRVGSWSQYPLVDDPLQGSGLLRFGGFQSGLRFADGRAKPGVYAGYRMPIFVRALSGSRVEVFGGLRRADGGGTASVESRAPGSAFAPVPGGSVQLGPRGYFRAFFSLPAARRREFRIVAGGITSRRVRAVRR